MCSRCYETEILKDKGAIETKNLKWETDDFITHLYQAGYFHILEIIIFNLNTKSVMEFQKVSPGKLIFFCCYFYNESKIKNL